MTPPTSTSEHPSTREPEAEFLPSPAASESSFAGRLFVETTRIILPLVIIAAGVGALLLLYSQRKSPEVVERNEHLPQVRTVAVKTHDDGLDIEVDGLVVPYRDIVLSAEIAGKITVKTAECEAGRFVKAGTPLIEIDRRRYALEVERLKSELEQADAVLGELSVEEASTEALIELANEDVALQQRNLKRTEQLFAQNVATDTALDEARATELATRNKLQTLKNERLIQKTRRTRLVFAKELAAARLEEAKIDLANAEVRAPVDGVIISDAVEQGSYVQPGTPLLTIEDTSKVEVTSNFRVEELNWLWRQDLPTSLGEAEREATRAYRLPQTPATVSYELAGHEYSWEGFVSRYDGLGMDQQTRTVPVRISVPQPRVVTVDGTPGQLESGEGPRALVRGMYVTVNVHTNPEVDLLQVPERAVRPGNVVWCVRDGKLHVVHIHVARMFDDNVLVEKSADGLQAGDRLVVSPLSVAVDEMPVREEPAE